MDAAEKNAMLKDLGVLVKVGQHVNIAGLIGVCDEPGKIRCFLNNKNIHVCIV